MPRGQTCEAEGRIRGAQQELVDETTEGSVKGLTLSADILCPVCSKKFHAGLSTWGGNFFPCCQGKTCRARFWVCELIPPNPRTHLVRLLTAEGAACVLSSIEIPMETQVPIYLIALLSPRQVHEARRDGLSKIFRDAA